jgi:NAD(P)-dependent dehydrogenase (short-subunit alcohol dehydrogenase family)
MLIGTLDQVEVAPEYPEMAGRRILVTGVRGVLGVDVVRLLAEARTRLVVQADEDGPETQALAEIIAPFAMEVKLFPGRLESSEDMLRFAREAAQKFGGLDAVVNLAVTDDPGPDAGTEADVERHVAAALAMPVLATRVAVNRMRTMLSPGVIVNIVASPPHPSHRARLLAAIARTALANFTRTEAAAAAADGIHINAIVPAASMTDHVSGLSGTADVASLVQHLISGRSPDLSGLVFEAWCG